MDSLKLNLIWIFCFLPKDRRNIKIKQVFKIKHKINGSIHKYKARLVAKGLTQLIEIDYVETFSPIVKINSICILLTLIVHYDYEVHQIDVKTTFLNVILHEHIYMVILEGLTTPSQPNLVSKLFKYIYGLRQSSWAWYERFDIFLHHIIFKKN